MSKLKENGFMMRQGDVLVAEVESIPATATRAVPREKDGNLVLAHGEVTGHRHRIPSRHATMTRTETDARYMRVTAPVGLNHEEHKTLCAQCLLKGDVVEATRVKGTTYACGEHVEPKMRKLDDAGRTEIPRGEHVVVGQVEYTPTAIVPVVD